MSSPTDVPPTLHELLTGAIWAWAAGGAVFAAVVCGVSRAKARAVRAAFAELDARLPHRWRTRGTSAFWCVLAAPYGAAAYLLTELELTVSVAGVGSVRLYDVLLAVGLNVLFAFGLLRLPAAVRAASAWAEVGPVRLAAKSQSERQIGENDPPTLSPRSGPAVRAPGWAVWAGAALLVLFLIPAVTLNVADGDSLGLLFPFAFTPQVLGWAIKWRAGLGEDAPVVAEGGVYNGVDVTPWPLVPAIIEAPAPDGRRAVACVLPGGCAKFLLTPEGAAVWDELRAAAAEPPSPESTR